ncbi:cysteine desulfurase family protein [Cyanobium sp. WAJ14-Wanaka]|uniref:cysteine desulfurase family protein n=1 Tax=Cyanobium sp. WAJ14-Wanaka TaxID=2823725 RepID=UPI0020CD4D82|nr:cysteine desulfurase family protein [Cyanobium sp. WAJ14-Wanaka]MCP9775365.1 cysteine desulfurase [Cyanobium sp. WAJ14-Wanaka]
MLAYLDHHATTPCDPAVVEAMAPWWTEQFANPASRNYQPGLLAAAAVQNARSQIVADLGVQPESVIFTSGATEANNLALKGLAEAEIESGGQRRHLVTLATEHRAVLDPLRYLARHGFELTELAVLPNGLINLEELAAALRPDTLLVSVMAANNEIGVLQPMAEIAALCHQAESSHQKTIHLHCDGAQAVGHIPLQPADLGVDLLSISGHKLYGPKGIGALVVKPGIRLAAQLHGGGQEQGVRAGSLPVPLIVGLAKALQLALADQQLRSERLGELRDQLWRQLEPLGDLKLNGDLAARLPHNLNLTVGGVDGARLHQLLRRKIAVSSGSACSQGSPSHVLAALGRSRQEAGASIRFGLGRHTTAAEISCAAVAVAEAIRSLR